MIISVAELKRIPEFSGIGESILQRKLDGIEELIRAYTNNNFQNRNIRFSAPSINGVIKGHLSYLKVGDTLQITDSINKGLVVITGIDRVNRTITFDKTLYDSDINLMTKVEYPASIVDGVINLLQWDVQNRQKVGVQSETLSRHSVTYFAQDEGNQLMGYPSALLGFLKPYCKARF